MEFWNLIIGVLALIVAGGGYVYTWHFNKYSVELIDCEIDLDRDQKHIYFSLINTSSRSIKIEKVELLSNGKSIVDNGFDVDAFEDEAANHEIVQRVGSFGFPTATSRINAAVLENARSDNFHSATILVPNVKKEFSYYVDEIPKQIVIVANHQLAFFTKTKTFDITFDKIE